MKYLKHFFLGVIFLSTYSYGADIQSYGGNTNNETSKAIAAVSACFQNTGSSLCLSNVGNKEKAQYEAAYSAFSKGLINIGNDNGPRLAREATQGKKLWESALKHDCEARGLQYDDGSPAFDDSVTNCLAIQYARRADFYNGFTINSDYEAVQKILKKYKKQPPSQ